MGEGDSLDPAADTSVVDIQNLSIVEFDAFANYIKKAVTILLPEDDCVPPALSSALDDPENQEKVKKFLSDPQCQALYIQRTCSKGEWK